MKERGFVKTFDGETGHGFIAVGGRVVYFTSADIVGEVPAPGDTVEYELLRGLVLTEDTKFRKRGELARNVRIIEPAK